MIEFNTIFAGKLFTRGSSVLYIVEKCMCGNYKEEHPFLVMKDKGIFDIADEYEYAKKKWIESLQAGDSEICLKH